MLLLLLHNWVDGFFTARPDDQLCQQARLLLLLLLLLDWKWQVFSAG